GDLKKMIKKEKKHDFSEINADKLLLIYVYKHGEPATGTRALVKTNVILSSIVYRVIAAASLEEMDYERMETPRMPEFLKLLGWQFDRSLILAKVMNLLYKLKWYKLIREMEERCMDVL
ncbi:hypothetical protein HK098_006626, partial [Nowakowskiella sp. JEL0407]